MHSPIKILWRKLRYGDPVVVVSGLPRSGTSMMMKMLEAGGLEVFTDEVREADEDNPKGYFEHEQVKHLHETDDRSWVRQSRGKAIKVVSELLPHLPEGSFYQVIFMKRPLDEILASQNKMLERRGEPNTADDSQMRELFETHLWRVQRFLRKKRNFHTQYVGYRETIVEPMVEARRVCGFLGDTLDAELMAAVVDPSLYRNRAG